MLSINQLTNFRLKKTYIKVLPSTREFKFVYISLQHMEDFRSSWMIERSTNKEENSSLNPLKMFLLIIEDVGEKTL